MEKITRPPLFSFKNGEKLDQRSEQFHTKNAKMRCNFFSQSILASIYRNNQVVEKEKTTSTLSDGIIILPVGQQYP